MAEKKQILEYYWKNTGTAKAPKWKKEHTKGWLKAHPPKK